jgi:hypothetical protein
MLFFNYFLKWSCPQPNHILLLLLLLLLFLFLEVVVPSTKSSRTTFFYYYYYFYFFLFLEVVVPSTKPNHNFFFLLFYYFLLLWHLADMTNQLLTIRSYNNRWRTPMILKICGKISSDSLLCNLDIYQSIMIVNERKYASEKRVKKDAVLLSGYHLFSLMVSARMHLARFFYDFFNFLKWSCPQPSQAEPIVTIIKKHCKEVWIIFYYTYMSSFVLYHA